MKLKSTHRNECRQDRVWENRACWRWHAAAWIAIAGLGSANASAALAGLGSASAALQEFKVVITSDNVYEVYLGDANGQGYDAAGNLVPGGTTVKDVGGAIKHNLQGSGSILEATTFTLSAPDIHWVYIAAWSDDVFQQGLLADFNNLTLHGHLLSGDAQWQVTATGIDRDGLDLSGNPLNLKPTPTQMTDEIMRANLGSAAPMPNPSGGWVTPAVFLSADNAAGGIYHNQVVVPGGMPLGTAAKVADIDGRARWMWHDSNPNDANDAFTVGADHGEFLIFRIPVTAVGSVPEPSTGVAGLLLALFAGVARRRSARKASEGETVK
jgi:hypothetical protein